MFELAKVLNPRESQSQAEAGQSPNPKDQADKQVGLVLGVWAFIGHWSLVAGAA
jgi:hypothetical protein